MSEVGHERYKNLSEDQNNCQLSIEQNIMKYELYYEIL